MQVIMQPFGLSLTARVGIIGGTREAGKTGISVAQLPPMLLLLMAGMG